MPGTRNALFPYLLGTGLLLSQCFSALADGPDEAGLRQRALVSRGDVTRAARVLERARRGEAVTIGVIGGSITAGASATTEENRYGNRLAQWWRERFPQCKVELVNAGIGATGSNYGALRAGRDLLAKHPDFVVVEYAVNDSNTEASAETVEGLVRQILAQPNEPAVVLLFMMAKSAEGAGNAQEWLSKIGAHYDLPMLSYRDALWPEIAAERLAWEDVMADVVHPSDRGHEYAASFVEDLLTSVTAPEATADLKPLPAPLISDLFEHVALYEADTLTPTRNEGWAYDAGSRAWIAREPGNVIEFEVEGQVLLEMDYVIRGAMGKARIQVDDREPIVNDGWFDQTWGGWRRTTELARGLGAGKHRIRLTVLEDKSPDSTGHEFWLFGLGAAGVGER